MRKSQKYKNSLQNETGAWLVKPDPTFPLDEYVGRGEQINYRGSGACGITKCLGPCGLASLGAAHLSKCGRYNQPVKHLRDRE
jgi:hypothetical protein